MSDEKRFLIIDSNSLIHRAFHALPPLTSKSGELVNALYGFSLIFFRALKDLHPQYIAAAFDYPAPTFRHEKFKEYKAKRPKAPPELYSQIPKVKELLQAFNVEMFEKQGFEADDVIATLSKLILKRQVFPKLETIILTSDKDALQLIDKQTKVYLIKKGVKDAVLYDEEKVKEEYGGLTPSQILDFKALRGDPSDNIPGVTGIGEKTAIELLLKFNSFDNLYKELEENTVKTKELKPRTRELLLKYKEQAFLSKDLAEAEKNVPLEFQVDKCKFSNFNKEKAVEMFNKYNFTSLLKRIDELNLEKEDSSILSLF